MNVVRSTEFWISQVTNWLRQFPPFGSPQPSTQNLKFRNPEFRLKSQLVVEMMSLIFYCYSLKSSSPTNFQYAPPLGQRALILPPIQISMNPPSLSSFCSYFIHCSLTYNALSLLSPLVAPFIRHTLPSGECYSHSCKGPAPIQNLVSGLCSSIVHTNSIA